MIPRHEEKSFYPKVQIDGMPHFTLFDHVHTIYERSSPTFFVPFHKELGVECKKNGHQKTGKVHQVSKVTAAVTQYFSPTTTLQKLVLQNLVLSPHVKIYIKEKEKLCAQ